MCYKLFLVANKPMLSAVFIAGMLVLGPGHYFLCIWMVCLYAIATSIPLVIVWEANASVSTIRENGRSMIFVATWLGPRSTLLC